MSVGERLFARFLFLFVVAILTSLIAELSQYHS